MLELDNNRFSIGKDIYYPYAVEMHYFRVEKRYWSVCFDRIKRAGFRILSTVVPWNLHQDKNKDFDFGGFSDSRKDLVVFLELAREFGFKVILRPGPWVSGQWPNGGLPDFVLRDTGLLAKNSQNELVDLQDPTGVPAGKLVSYMHPHFQHYLKNYFKNLIETTRNYIHPRGPVFMVEFDFETSFCHKTDPGDADYNEHIVSNLYPQFLEQKYEEVKQLNALYKEKNKEFAAVEPPREFKKVTTKDLPKLFDWFYFKEWYLSEFLKGLEELFKSYTVLPLFFRSLYFQPENPLPMFSLTTADEEGHLLSANVFPDGSYFDLMQKARYMQTMHGFSWASSFISGDMTMNRKESERMFPITDGRRRFYVSAGLAGGFKGFNHYMFVGRDHWYGAPVDRDGTIGSGFEIIKRLNIAIPKLEVNLFEPPVDIAAAFYRPYQWFGMLDEPKDFSYVRRLGRETFNGLCRDLSRLRIDFGLGDITAVERLLKFKTVLVPVAEFMSEEAQENIIQLIEKGLNLILVGLLPKTDENGKDCQILARYIHMKTTPVDKINEVECGKNKPFPAYLYGSIRSTDTKVKKLVTGQNNKLVGAVSSRFKGKVYLFTFDMASGGDYRKLVLFDTLMSDLKHDPPVYVSDPNIDVYIHKGEKAYSIFLLAPPAGELADATDFRKKQILLKVDLRKAGFKGTRIKLTDQFASEEDQPIRTSVDELKSGITLDMDSPDGRIYLVSK